MANYTLMQTARQSRIWETARQLSWLLAALSVLLAGGVRYFDDKARLMREEVDRMGKERLYLEGLTRDFTRVLDDVASAAVTNGSLRILLRDSGYQLKLDSSGGIPAPGRVP